MEEQIDAKAFCINLAARATPTRGIAFRISSNSHMKPDSNIKTNKPWGMRDPTAPRPRRHDRPIQQGLPAIRRLAGMVFPDVGRVFE
ncbi:hypothetical protein [Burkholderia ubonensis]|uniref:hypothetical protein n=1 Tax=Burkholderia ubonensis TaxID=101571 RepID=UPI000AAF273F|nr:hypothetical protein [Burkholderia ubonensis]